MLPLHDSFRARRIHSWITVSLLPASCALHRGVHTVRNGAVVSLLIEPVVCEGIRYAWVRGLDHFVLCDIVEALDAVRSWFCAWTGRERRTGPVKVLFDLVDQVPTIESDCARATKAIASTVRPIIVLGGRFQRSVVFV